MKKIVAALLCVAMFFSFAPITMAEGITFADVPQDAWYYEDVYNAVRLGIINGKSATSYAPDDNLTYAEAIKLAACMYQLYKEGQVLIIPGGEPWYQVYVDYCESAGIITKEYSYNEKASRAGYMEIFANALPDSALPAINNVPDGSIPDVRMNEDYTDEIYKLYRAGILQGVDAAHRCEPSSTIKRSEVAAIITRMMDENKRIKFNMGGEEVPVTEAPITETPKTEAPKLEIPDDAEEVPIIEVTPQPTEFVETPDMYEPFEIVEEPRYIGGADEGEVLHYTIEVTGGKAPYTYQWGSRSRHNQVGSIQDGEYVKGATTNTLSFTYSVENPYTDPLCCIVTDALGQTVKSDYVNLPEQIFIFRPDQVIQNDLGYIFAGRVEKGSLKVGETVAISIPGENVQGYGTVTAIEMFNKRLDEAKAGDYCGILMEDFQEYPYDQFVSESYSESTMEYLESKDTYGVKIPLKATQGTSSANKNGIASLFLMTRGGTPPYTYEWYAREGAGEFQKIENNHKYKIEGNGLSITVDEAEYANDVNYRCVITDAAGNTEIEDNWRLFSETVPYISKQPEDAYANVGDEVTFRIRSRGLYESYQWYVKYDGRTTWQKIEMSDSWAEGEKTPILKIRVEKEDFKVHCEYRCEVTQGSYTEVSQAARILPIDLVITKDPENQQGSHGGKVQFHVVAEGANGPFTYQWLLKTPDNEYPLQITEGFPWAEGQTTDTLTVLVDATKLTSEYTFSCIVTDQNGVRRYSKEAYAILVSDPNVTFEENKTQTGDMIIIID